MASCPFAAPDVQPAPATGSAERHHLPALDGLRALAVLGVIAYHLALPWAPGGYLGVDLFFVLSGFLITGLLFAERERSGRVDLGRFYRRRARRLLPALLLVLLAVSLWVAAGGSGLDGASFRRDVLATLGYVANWRLVFSHQSYFAQFSLPSPLRHTWSLAIEEQYYLLWPPILLVLVRLGRGSRRRVLGATLLLAGLSAAAMAAQYHPGADPSRLYYGTDTRAFELLIGSALALATARRQQSSRRWSALAGVTGIAVLAALVLTVHDSTGWMYRGGFVVAAVAAALAIWSVARPQPGRLGAVLSIRPLQWVGSLSYGLYLWHWPVIDLLNRSRTGLSGWRLIAVQLGVTVAAATISYYALEQPVRSGRLPSWPRLLAAPALASILALALLPAVVGARPASADRTAEVAVSAAGPRVSAEAAAAASLTLAAPGTTAPPASVAKPPSVDLGLTATQADRTPGKLRVLVVGDSVMWDASPGIKAALESTGAATVDLRAVLGFGLSTSTYPWRTEWPRLVAADHPDVILALFGGWDAARQASNGAAWYTALVDQAVGLLTAGGARLVFLEYPRNQPPDVPGKPPVDQASDERQRELVNFVFAGEAVRHPGAVGYLPLDPVLDDNGQYTAFLPAVDGILERVRKHDNIHFCPAGAARVGEWVLAALSPPFGLPAATPGWAAGPWRADSRYNQPAGACA